MADVVANGQAVAVPRAAEHRRGCGEQGSADVRASHESRAAARRGT
ncbi:hypothetical protein AB0H12_01945 [Actinosynnema sp. NPDC023794]